MSEEHARKLCVENTSAVVWKTGNDNIKTDKKVKTHFILPELYPERIIEHTFHLLPTTTGYDMIIGTNLMSELGLQLNFQDACVEWEDASMPFKDRDATFETAFLVEDIGSVRESMDRIKRILDATYEKAYLEKITSECQHLSIEEHESLLTLLTKYESLFDGTLGFWNHEEYDIELQPGVKPYHAHAYPIPKIHEQHRKALL